MCVSRSTVKYIYEFLKMNFVVDQLINYKKIMTRISRNTNHLSRHIHALIGTGRIMND